MQSTESQNSSKKKLIREAFSSEVISIIGDIFAGSLLYILILPFQSFIALIIFIPALLSLRGNISGPFIARTSKDLIVGEFDKRSWIENVLATVCLSMVTAFLIGVISIYLNYILLNIEILSIYQLIMIPIVTILLSLTFSIPCSTSLNIIAFKYGLDPNNLVNPIMTAVDDFLTIISFFIAIILLGVN
ncbi:MAG: magnesium transporter [Candidatus Lokiarchaeota archaeon]|nr:magnesium transporter [Candidatus Lokiarchaeota archaeon]